MALKELLHLDEEVHDLRLGLSLETSVYELQHPKPLPRGSFRIENFYAAFKNYPHAFHDFGGQLTINDTALLLKNFTGGTLLKTKGCLRRTIPGRGISTFSCVNPV